MLIEQLTLKELSKRLRANELSAQTLMALCAENYVRYEPLTHAYKTWNGETATKVADAADLLLRSGTDLGPLMGIPISAKDLYGVPGLPTYAGSTEKLPASWEQPGRLMQAILKQGAPVAGKTHTVEFAFGGIGINNHWGTPVNPWDSAHARIPGGSSSGAGVSLSQGSALLALGTDTAGSVRLPASFTGNVGLKTTVGRWPSDGIVPLSPSLDTPGILTRSVEDAAFGFSAIELMLTGKTVTPQNLASFHGIRFGVPEHFFWDDADASIVAEVEAVIKKITAMGGQVIPVQLPNCDVVYDIFKSGGLAASELSMFLTMTMPEKTASLDPMIKLRIEGAEAISSIEFLRRCEVLRQASQAAATFFDQKIDVLLTPTVAISPPKAADLADPDVYRLANMKVLRNASIANLMGLCALSMPIGKDHQQMPVGLQLMCGPNQEAKLLSIATCLEKKLGKPIDLLGKPPLLA